ncbi:MAG: neocarzinostatin apoprotein domain-containing protein [Acidimicrobiales bacterium]
MRSSAARLLAVVASLASVTFGALPAVDAAAAPPGASAPAVTVTPTSGIHSGADVTVSVSGEPAGTTLLAVECSAAALNEGEDACENGSDAVFWATGSGASTHLRVFSTISTAVGSINCMVGCLVGAVTLSGANSVDIVGVVFVSFSAPAAGPGKGPPAPPAWAFPPGVPAGTTITATKSLTAKLAAGEAPSLAPGAAVTGPGVSLRSIAPPTKPAKGVALLQLVLAAPGTSWSSATDTAAVVNVKIDPGSSQQIVLFAGARPFTYAAEFGDLETGDHSVTVSVSSALSTTGKSPPRVRVIAERLSIVTRSNPAYLAMQYAPIVYGRSDTASSDTPLLSYYVETDLSGGAHLLQYTTIWSKEDAGTSFVPWLEWGEWGRMTDITETTQLDVSASGAIRHPMFDSCGCSATYPQNRTSPLEEEVPFKGSYDGTHMIVRNASGNDYQDDTGRSAFDMEQPPVSGPAPGAVRESVMDANPWTYRVSAMELSRWYKDGSTSAASPEIGDSRQYAIIDIDCTATGTSAVGVAIRLKGSPTWYSSEYGGSYGLYDGGHGRTAVKLPEGWQSVGVAAVKVTAYGSAGSKPAVSGLSLTVVALTKSFGIFHAPHPAPVVVLQS